MHIAVRVITIAGPWSDAAVIAVPLATVIATLIGGVGTWLVRRQSRSTDAAAVRKSTAETTSIEVATARELIAEVRGMLDQQRAHYERLVAGMQGEIKGLTERVATNEEQQRALRSAFAAHETWDRDAVAQLRMASPDWPDPPPVSLD
ncbi:hypothetical protein ABZ671_00930 [Micromonospora sp. NPDC006766]|uniref:hypothetical protein n=1 Tax=Micromonospora sp. NPDC006766 TaxID=3154778 RepID=UPI0033D08052